MSTFENSIVGQWRWLLQIQRDRCHGCILDRIRNRWMGLGWSDCLFWRHVWHHYLSPWRHVCTVSHDYGSGQRRVPAKNLGALFFSAHLAKGRARLGKREWIYIHATVCHRLDGCYLGNDGDALGFARAHVNHIDGHLVRFLPRLYVFHLEKVDRPSLYCLNLRQTGFQVCGVGQQLLLRGCCATCSPWVDCSALGVDGDRWRFRRPFYRQSLAAVDMVVVHRSVPH